MNRDIDVFSDEMVYQRTMSGQRALLLSSESLPVQDRRFLAMVNGHTPLGCLLALGFPTDDMRCSIQLLIEQGLIESSSTWCANAYAREPVGRTGWPLQGDSA